MTKKDEGFLDLVLDLRENIVKNFIIPIQQRFIYSITPARQFEKPDLEWLLYVFEEGFVRVVTAPGKGETPNGWFQDGVISDQV